MKKLFQFIGLITLLFFSFYLNGTTKNVIKNMDDIMVQIKLNKKKYNQDEISAIIDGKYIIPGISKREVDIKKSYKNMKRNGKYDDNLYVYKYYNPKVSIYNNKDKIIISGNKKKRMISLNFIINDINDIKRLVQILNNNNIKATFFVNKKLLNNNIEDIYIVLKDGFLIGIKECNDSMIKIMTSILKEDNIYFLSSNNICKKDSIYNVGGIYIGNDYYKNSINKLESGAIFTFKVNETLYKELDYIIKYIENRGYSIRKLSVHLQE